MTRSERTTLKPTTLQDNQYLPVFDIEGLSERGILDMMHFFLDLDQYESDLWALQVKRRSFWFYHPNLFERYCWNIATIFQHTKYSISLRVQPKRRIRGEIVKSSIVTDGIFEDHPFMLRRIVNLVVNVKASANVEELHMILRSIEEQAETMPSLKRLEIRACDNMLAGTAEVMESFLRFPLDDFGMRTGIQVVWASDGHPGPQRSQSDEPYELE